MALVSVSEAHRLCPSECESVWWGVSGYHEKECKLSNAVVICCNVLLKYLRQLPPICFVRLFRHGCLPMLFGAAYFGLQVVYSGCN